MKREVAAYALFLGEWFSSLPSEGFLKSSQAARYPQPPSTGLRIVMGGEGGSKKVIDNL
jgi:hypothetical protein